MQVLVKSYKPLAVTIQLISQHEYAVSQIFISYFNSCSQLVDLNSTQLGSCVVLCK